MTHEAAVKAIDGAIYRATENLEDAQRFATEAVANANRAKEAWEKQQQIAEQKSRIAAEYREEILTLHASKRALTAHNEQEKS